MQEKVEIPGNRVLTIFGQKCPKMAIFLFVAANANATTAI
jgi:hypothetical protein